MEHDQTSRQLLLGVEGVGRCHGGPLLLAEGGGASFLHHWVQGSGSVRLDWEERTMREDRHGWHRLPVVALDLDSPEFYLELFNKVLEGITVILHQFQSDFL